MTIEEYRAGCALYKVHENGVGGCPLNTTEMCKKGRFNCKFRKTAEQKAEAGKRWRERLNSLPFKQQDYISGKYYFGTMPWKEDEQPNESEEV